MLELFKEYVKEVKSNPILVQDFVGKDATEVKRKKERPLTKVGFYSFVAEKGLNVTLKDYFVKNPKETYKEYFPICTRIKNYILTDQTEGGMGGIYNPSITQRLTGLADVKKIKANTTNMNLDIKTAEEAKAISKALEDEV